MLMDSRLTLHFRFTVITNPRDKFIKSLRYYIKTVAEITDKESINNSRILFPSNSMRKLRSKTQTQLKCQHVTCSNTIHEELMLNKLNILSFHPHDMYIEKEVRKIYLMPHAKVKLIIEIHSHYISPFFFFFLYPSKFTRVPIKLNEKEND